MSVSTITVGGQSVTLVSFPTASGLRGYEFTIEDRVGLVPSVFTGQAQTQQWPGADLWSATLTLAPLTQTEADDWTSFLMELRGMANAFQLGEKRKATPNGSVSGSPQVDNGVSGNLAASQFLDTKGWTPSATGVLKRGDQFQIDYRLYQVLNDVNADSSGKATLSIWPSLREQPTDSGALTTTNSKGLWRLAKNARGYGFDISRLVKGITIPIQEWR